MKIAIIIFSILSLVYCYRKLRDLIEESKQEAVTVTITAESLLIVLSILSLISALNH